MSFSILICCVHPHTTHASHNHTCTRAQIFLKVEQTKSSAIIQAYAIKAFPTFHLYRNGKRLIQIRGANKQALRSAIDTYVKIAVPKEKVCPYKHFPLRREELTTFQKLNYTWVAKKVRKFNAQIATMNSTKTASKGSTSDKKKNTPTTTGDKNKNTPTTTGDKKNNTSTPTGDKKKITPTTAAVPAPSSSTKRQTQTKPDVDMKVAAKADIVGSNVLTDADLTSVDTMLATLKSVGTDNMRFDVVMKLLRWPDQKVGPALHLLRKMLTNPQAAMFLAAAIKNKIAAFGVYSCVFVCVRVCSRVFVCSVSTNPQVVFVSLTH